MLDATSGLADVRIVRGRAITFSPHAGELTFGFVLSGSAKLVFGDAMPISPADAFVIPPRKAWSIAAGSDDFQLLHVTTARLRQFA